MLNTDKQFTYKTIHMNPPGSYSSSHVLFLRQLTTKGVIKLSKHRRKSRPQVIELDSYDKFKKQQRVEIIPRNTKQEEYVEHLSNAQRRIIFALGPAGTGKTLLATLQAIKELKNKRINRIIITRPAVEVDEKHGFLPGDLTKKMEPWTRPIFDVFGDFYNSKDIALMLEEGIIEIAPLAYLRGRTFKNSVVILDEAQNTTISQMKMVLTRIGEHSRMFVTGDLAQTDLLKTNGLVDFTDRLDVSSKSIVSCKFEKSHIERDPVVAEVLKIYGD